MSAKICLIEMGFIESGPTIDYDYFPQSFHTHILLIGSASTSRFLQNNCYAIIIWICVIFRGKYKASDNRIMSLLSHIEMMARNCHHQQGLPIKWVNPFSFCLISSVSSEKLALLRLARCELSRLRCHGYSVTAFFCPLIYAG